MSNAPRQEPKEQGGKLGRELFGLVFIFIGLLILLSLATFDSRDPWLNHVVSSDGPIFNRAGRFGSYLSGSLYDLFGLAGWAVPAFFCLAGARRVLSCKSWPWWRWIGFILLAVCLTLIGAARDNNIMIASTNALSGDVSSHGGGLLGHALYNALMYSLSRTGTILVGVFAFLLSVQLLVGFSWIFVVLHFVRGLWRVGSGMAGTVIEKRAREKERRELEGAVIHDVKAIEPFSGESADAGMSEKKRGRTAKPVAPHMFDSGSSSDSAVKSRAKDAAIPEKTDPNQPEQLPKDAARQESPVPIHGPGRFAPSSSLEDEYLSLAPHASDTAEKLAMEDDPDMPPWVKDFENDCLGVPQSRMFPDPGSSASHPASPAFPAWSDEWSQSSAGRPQSSAGASSMLTMERPFPIDGNAPPVLRPETTASASIDPALDILAPGATSRDSAVASGESNAQPLNVTIHESATVKQAENLPGQPGLIERIIKKPQKHPLPPLSRLEAAPATSGVTPRHILEAKGRALMTCLTDFSIQGELVGITPGPVVTMFEFRPAPGVRVSRIANLSDDLALALKAVAVRIQAPVPGTDTVGIEIPNEVREMVCFREMIGSEAFQSAQSLLTIALGKDIAGAPVVANLATMPHLLVAGATGSGKSVGINSIILSLLYKARPDEVKLLLVDPKRVEMAIYSDLPHLVHPVVTEMALAKNALDWAVSEMEQRYDDIARAGVRNIADYNAKLKEMGDKRPEGMEDLEFMPYLVIVIDELADLMLVAAKEVETSIVRLAQLARAAGIHLILATQRPSVDVVTGIIKANFPCRIAFQVTSKHDSRTILDSIGAEHLLGRGDMLFKPSGGKFQRLHGAFVSDKNVLSVTDYWRALEKPSYQLDFTEWGQEKLSNGLDGPGSDISGDALYLDAVDFVRQQGRASISLIQRRFRIGFNKAARLVDQMEQDGLIGPPDGSKPRVVIK